MLAALGKQGLLRGLFGGRPDEPVRDAAAMQLCLLRESLAQISGEAETALALQGLGSYPILQAGSPTQIERWLPGVVSGETVAAFALSEPNAGSDAAALSLRAEPDGDGWRLHGEKVWISNAPEADVYSVFARTTPGFAGARHHRVRRRRKLGGTVRRAPRPARCAPDRAAGLRRRAGRPGERVG